MRLKTEEFLNDCWLWLSMRDHQFDSRGDFVDWAEESQPEVDYGAVNTYLTKINSDEGWDADNATIVNITTDGDWNMIQAGAISFGGEV